MFKYGSGKQEKRGKHYSDFNEKGISDVLAGTGLMPIEVWKFKDALGGDYVWHDV